MRHTSLPSYVRTCKRSFEVSGRGAVAINLIPFSVYVVTIVESIVLFFNRNILLFASHTMCLFSRSL